MIERFDPSIESKNQVYQIFSREHLRRYEISRDWILKCPIKNKIILDAAFGCGYGYPILSGLGKYVGLDCSQEAVSEALRKYPSGDFRLADLDDKTGLAIYNIAPSIIVSLETAEHLRDPEGFLRRCHAFLPDNGLLIFSAPTSLTRDFDPYHLRDWNSERWGEALEGAGFVVHEKIKMPFETSFWEFLHIIPTSWRQKGQVGKFWLKHPCYFLDRLWNWGVRGKFFWESTIFRCCRA